MRLFILGMAVGGGILFPIVSQTWVVLFGYWIFIAILFVLNEKLLK